MVCLLVTTKHPQLVRPCEFVIESFQVRLHEGGCQLRGMSHLLKHQEANLDLSQTVDKFSVFLITVRLHKCDSLCFQEKLHSLKRLEAFFYLAGADDDLKVALLTIELHE